MQRVPLGAPMMVSMKQVFPIVPAANSTFVTIAAILLFMLGLAAIFAWFAYSARNVHFEVSPQGIRISGAMYGRTIPASEIMPGAKAVDLNEDRELALSMRTNGVGLPGYRAGWFRLRNGEKALAFVTDMRRVTYFRTKQGYSVLLSVEHPQHLADAIRSISQ